MLNNILAPALSISALGLIFGIILAVAARFFAVKGDPKVGEIREALPGANCGGCGYPGCDAFAEAVAKGEAQVNGCPVANADQTAQIAKIMGVEAADMEPLVAVVRCQGTMENSGEKYSYDGIQDCAAAAALADGYKMCRFSCMGLGNCVRVCPTNAITIENNLAVIDQDKCIACGKCAAECPRGIIGLVPESAATVISCRATAKGKEVRDACKVGCIGCGICAKVCPFNAIEMVDDLPRIDYDKCVNCGLCAEKCPRDCISFDKKKDEVAFITEEKCVGCTLCARKCKFDAIEGEVKTAHKVIADKCVGCGECEKACRFDAIRMIAK